MVKLQSIQQRVSSIKNQLINNRNKNMKSNYRLAIVMAAGVVLATGTFLRAADANGNLETTTPPPTAGADNSGSDKGVHYDQNGYYRCNELSLDAFGVGSLGSYTINNLSSKRVRQNSKFGAGAGINYFITKYVGIGALAYSENTSGTFIDNVAGNLILRLPLGQSGFAPYVFGGVGHQFDGAKLWFGQAGAGMEYRFTRNIGAFVDVCAVWPNETKYYGIGRLGLRFAF
jgi:hypothetical protein